MQAILSMIYCFLVDMIASFRDVGIESWDSVLGVLDTTLIAIGTGGLVLPVIPAEYTWMLGATGMSQALTIVAGAMGVRFLLQTVPFVRWASEVRWQLRRLDVTQSRQPRIHVDTAEQVEFALEQ